jgi:hypothetical protein
VTILGSETATIGGTLKLTCVADAAWTDVFFLWLRGERVIRSSVYEKRNVTADDAGWYTCLAGSDGDTQEASIKVAVVARAGAASGQANFQNLSTKEIIMYVFLTIAIILIIVCCAFAIAIYFNRLKTERKVADIDGVDNDFYV